MRREIRDTEDDARAGCERHPAGDTQAPFSRREEIRIVLEGLRGEYSIAELCRREGIAESLYYSWSKEFLEAGKRRLAGDTATGRDQRRGDEPPPRGSGHEDPGR